MHADSEFSPETTVNDLCRTYFPGVEPGVVDALVAQATPVQLEPGDFAAHASEPSDSFYVVVRGSARAFHRSPDGVEVDSRLLQRGTLFGVTECLLGLPYLETVQVKERSLVLRIPRAALQSALRASHSLTRLLLRDAAARLAVALSVERLLAFHPVEVRLANLLTRYLDMYGLPAPNGIRIRIPLSQDDLANGLGVARRSITRTLKTWSTAGIIEKEGRHYVVLDPEALALRGDAEAMTVEAFLKDPRRPRGLGAAA